MKPSAITPRMQTCLDAGSSAALFPILKDWDEAELRALVLDVSTYYERECERIDEVWGKAAVEPSAFFSKGISEALDGHRDAAKLSVRGICSEIAAVALYYLEPRQ